MASALADQASNLNIRFVSPATQDIRSLMLTPRSDGGKTKEGQNAAAINKDTRFQTEVRVPQYALVFAV